MDNEKTPLTIMQKRQLEDLFTKGKIDYIKASHNYALTMLRKWYRLGAITQSDYQNCTASTNGVHKTCTVFTVSGRKRCDFNTFISKDELKRTDQQVVIHRSARDFAFAFLRSEKGDIWKSENKSWSDRQVLRDIENAFKYIGVNSSLFKRPYGKPNGKRGRLLVTQSLKELLEYMLLYQLYKYGTVDKLPKREKVILRQLLSSAIESFGDCILPEEKVPIMNSFCDAVGLAPNYVSRIHEEVRQALARESGHRKLPYEKVLLYQSDIERIDRDFSSAITALMAKVEADLKEKI